MSALRGEQPPDGALRRASSTTTTPGSGVVAASASTVGSLLRQVSAGRTSELIVDQVRRLIREGQLSPGDRLPPERELSALFGVSRVTVREALRVLESGGLVAIKTGSRGGAFVTAPSSVRVGQGLTDLITMSTLDAADVTEVRRVLELGFVPLVCERGTTEDFDDLERLCEEAGEAIASETLTMEHSTRFHVRLAESAHNGALDLLVQSFREALRASLLEARAQAPEMGILGNEEHVQLVAALRARKPRKAAQILQGHLDRTARRIAHRES